MSDSHNEPVELFERVYEKLHALATRKFAGQANITLQPTALVHEVYVKLAQSEKIKNSSREHFFAIAATAMRQILVDAARQRNALKRAGGLTRVTLVDNVSLPQDVEQNALMLNDVINKLTTLNSRQAKIVEMRVFSGMTVSEIATVLSLSKSAIEKEWRRARAWLRSEIESIQHE